MTGKSEGLAPGTMKGIPLGRLGQPEDIAGLAAFVAGPDSGWVMRANGGSVSGER